jgi:hypothetical protein
MTKNYRFNYEVYHESFGGHDHRDGEGFVDIKASNEIIAHKKFNVISKKKYKGGYWTKIISVWETK